MRLPQTTSATADTIVTDTNDYFTDNEIDGLTCVKGRVNAYYTLIIPSTRVAEFEAGNDTLKDNFVTITKNAQSPTYTGVDFLDAWETEYAIIYP